MENKTSHIDNTEKILTEKDFDNVITFILNQAQLNYENNSFFKNAAEQQTIHIESAFNIAYNWHAITKTFLFTAIRGAGSLAEKIDQTSNPNLKLLSVLQTGFSIISDDLSNAHIVFKYGAELGVHGAHYKWWENTILTPLSKFITNNNGYLMPGTIMLNKKMRQLCKHYMGLAVQLRIVEAIALDICEAFLSIFSQVKYNDKNIFDKKSDLIWITSHIEAEKIHHEQVRNGIVGMGRVALTQKDQEEFLELTRDFGAAWKDALDDFNKLLKWHT